MNQGTFDWYKDTLTKVLFRPIYFFTTMEKGPLKDKPVTFLLLNCWVFSLLISAFLFMAAIYPMVSVVLTGINGPKLAIIIPLFAFFCFMFFAMVLIIAGPMIIAALFSLSLLLSLLLHYIAGKFGGVGKLSDMIRASFYCGAVIIPFSLMPVIAAAARYGLISRQNLNIGAGLLFTITIIYLWGLWSIAIRKIYGISRKKALSASFITAFLVILLQMALGPKIMTIIERWTV